MKYKFWAVLPFIFMLIAGCGYHFVSDKKFPFQVTSIFVPVFENNTSEAGIETMVTNHFIYELVRSGNVKVAEKDVADALFYGTIKSLSTHTISRSNIQSPLERRITMILDLKLTGRQGQVLWVSRGFSDHESYVVHSDKIATEASQIQAIRILSKRMAEKIYYRLMDIE